MYCSCYGNFKYSGIPISRTSRGNANWFEKSGVKLQCLIEEREQLLVQVIGRFEKMRVREIAIPLYYLFVTESLLTLQPLAHRTKQC